MKKRMKKLLLAACCMCAGILAWADSASAAKISSVSQAKQKALQQVPNAVVTDTDRDYEDGVLVYEIDLVKGSKKYDIIYRASDGKMVSYGWEKVTVSASRSKPLISQSRVKSLAASRVKNGTILSISQKTDDGVDIYKVKMSAGSKRYTLKYHARTGVLIDYEWELVSYSGGQSSSSSGSSYIGLTKAKQIALADVPGGTVVKAEFDTDDGVPVYEIEIIKGNYEYEYKIHAKTGTVLEKEKDWND